MCELKHVEHYYTVEPIYNGHHWDQRFCPYSEVSFAQGVIVDHAPLTINHSQLCWSKAMDHEISCIDKISIDI